MYKTPLLSYKHTCPSIRHYLLIPLEHIATVSALNQNKLQLTVYALHTGGVGGVT